MAVSMLPKIVRAASRMAKPTARTLPVLEKDFFPTSKSVANRMLDWVTEGRSNLGSILEPHAGEGHLVQEIFGRTGIVPSALEKDPMKVAKLRAKGVPAIEDDFLHYSGTHDTIVMNPPFSGGQARQHILHALDLLNPGGKGVSLVPARDMLPNRPTRRLVESNPNMHFLGLTNMTNPKVAGKRKSVAIIGFNK